MSSTDQVGAINTSPPEMSMHQFYIVEPEVAGGLGPNSRLDTSVFPPKVSALHFVFEGWLGDPILESFPCFIVTEELGRRMSEAGITGFQLHPVEVSISDSFHSSRTSVESKEFRWLLPDARWGQNDFGTTEDGRLVVSHRALELMVASGMNNAEVEPAH